MSQNWRTEVDAGDYFGHQQKKLQFADRRPVIRKASDLVGPGIGANAVRLTDFNDFLATYDGFFSADVGAYNAPNTTDSFVGTVASDATLGGVQTFASITTGAIWRRVFSRNPADASAVYWGTWVRDLSDVDWTVIGATGAPAFQNAWANYGGVFATAAFMRKGGIVRLRGLIAAGTVGATIFNLPAGYRPNAQLLFSTISNAAVGRVDVTSGGDVQASSGSNAWLALDGLSFLAEQ